MHTRQGSDVLSPDELTYLGRLASTRALPAHLLARIARRPGRWRRRMRPRLRGGEELATTYHHAA